MAVNVDTVYQRVLAIANKEQRGYITPQEFNLFANQAQMSIFEQYFYDINQFDRLPGNNTSYSDMITLLEEKISIFKKRHQAVAITSQYGDGTLPADMYRLGTLLRYPLTGVANSTTAEIQVITEEELLYYNASPLAAPSVQRPVYLRTGSNSIKIYPHSATPSLSAAVYFTQPQCVLVNGNTSVTINNVTGNFSFIEPGQTVIHGSINANTTVVSIVDNGNGTGTLVLSAAPTSGGTVSLTFASDDIKCNYIRRPINAAWGYTSVNSTALYNSGLSIDFELHDSEETNLVIKILALAGIALKDPSMYQIATSEENRSIQQEKS